MAVLASLGACGTPEPAATRADWLIGRTAPAFDPWAAPHPVRAALERLLARGLVDEDSAGRIVPAGAREVRVSDEGRTLTFTIDPTLRYSDGAPVLSADFRESLLRGIGRDDHATARWLLRSVRGVARVRPGRDLPPIGIECPDDTTLVMHLERPDSTVLRALALPGVGVPWRSDDGAAGWTGRFGTGPYRVADVDAARLVLVRTGQPGWEGPDSIHVRFARGGVRPVHVKGGVDLLWPSAIGGRLRGEGMSGFRWRVHDARPRRLLVLVMRPDVPPTSRLAARRALAHGVNRQSMMRAVGDAAIRPLVWFDGGAPFDPPAFDASEVQGWMARGKLGRSFRTVLAYDPEEVDPSLVRPLLEDWAQFDLLVDARSLRGEAMARERGSGRAHLVLTTLQPPLDGAGPLLAALASPDRSGAVGGLRTGWRTPFDRGWERPGGPREAADADAILARELVALPLARLGWAYAERQGTEWVAFHPRFGPELAKRVTVDDPISLND